MTPTMTELDKRSLNITTGNLNSWHLALFSVDVSHAVQPRIQVKSNHQEIQPCNCSTCPFSAETVAKTRSELFADFERSDHSEISQKNKKNMPGSGRVLKGIRIRAVEEIPFVRHEPKPELLSESIKQKPAQKHHARLNQGAAEKHTRKMP